MGCETVETTIILAIITAVLAILAIGLTVKLYLLRKAAREIREQFAERLNDNTSTIIYLSSRDKQMCTLANDINTELKKLHSERVKFIKGDLELKTAVTNISHDLRTPLTSIYGYLDLLENEEQSETVSRYLSLIKNRTDALKQLTEELFKYSLGVSEQTPHFETVDLCSVTEQTMLSFYSVFQQRGITPEIQFSETPVYRTADKEMLGRVLSNIISNAVKYSDGDFSVSTDDTGAVIFSNTAKSLDTISVGKLFDRFYTVQANRNSTGLGLSIAKYLTELMHGTLTATYQQNKLYITLYFPE